MSFINLLLLAGGLLALFAGGEMLLRGGVALAYRLSLSPFIVAVVVLGFGTSLPELLVTVRAVFAGTPQIALGNVIGSNIANILLIAGISVMLAGRDSAPASAPRVDLAAMALATAAAVIALQFGTIDRVAGLALLAGLAAYLWQSLRANGQARADAAETPTGPSGLSSTSALILAGLVLLFAGADMLVRGAVAVARDVGISEAVIGLTVVAVGTSLPELATSLVAAWRGHQSVAIGNVIGSNIFNLLGILGIAALLTPIATTGIGSLDIWMLALSTLLLAGLLAAARRLSPWIGVAMLTAYGAYTVFLFQTD